MMSVFEQLKTTIVLRDQSIKLEPLHRVYSAAHVLQKSICISARW